MADIHPFNGVYSGDAAGKVDDTLPTTSKRGLVHRHVEWLNSGKGICFRAKRILAWMERIVLDLTVVCVPFVRSAVKYAKSFRAEELGKKYVDEVKTTKKPPEFTSFSVTTDTQAMNHTTYYAINDGVIWYKQMKEGAQWQPMPFTTGTEPRKIRVDGANLCVEDSQSEIYYRKILREGQRGDASGDTYVFRDKSERNNFKETWFTLPMVSTVLTPFVSARLTVDPSETKDWAIAHRGQFNHYIEDAAGQKHTVDVGVTTLYMLDADGRNFSLFDPWKPEWVKVSIPTPETSHSKYEALTFVVAASTLMTIGYETATNTAGKHSKTLKIETLLADIDGLGWNPGLKFDFKKKSDPDVRVLGEVKWKEHALPDDPTDRLTKQISILQTGEGNNARELRVMGSRSGQAGFFYKPIAEDVWSFQPVEGLQIDEVDFLAPTQEVHETPEYRAKDYSNNEVTLKDFTPDKVSSTLEFRGNKIMVYRKVNIIKKALGQLGEKFDVVPPESMKKEDVEALKRALKVSKLHGILPSHLLANLKVAAATAATAAAA